ncbi:MAG: transposase [Melioribacteraceae bacterium]
MKERKRNRLQEYDYSQSGYYFVTLCTDDHKPFFGKIINGEMILNQFGYIIKNNWIRIQSLHKNIELDEFVIMPNHIHGIIIINGVGNAKFAFPTNRTKMTLSKLIQQFKRACTIEIKNKFNYHIPLWQHSFYDRIIRNENELYQIRKYILQNPLKWEVENNSIENLELH